MKMFWLGFAVVSCSAGICFAGSFFGWSFDLPTTPKTHFIKGVYSGQTVGIGHTVDGSGANHSVSAVCNIAQNDGAAPTLVARGQSERWIEHCPPPYDVAVALEVCSCRAMMKGSLTRAFPDYETGEFDLNCRIYHRFDWDGFGFSLVRQERLRIAGIPAGEIEIHARYPFVFQNTFIFPFIGTAHCANMTDGQLDFVVESGEDWKSKAHFHGDLRVRNLQTEVFPSH